MEITAPALASLIALAAIVIFSCFKDINVGIMASPQPLLWAWSGPA